MLINLYGSKGLVFQTLATGFNEAHIQDKIKFDVVEADKVGSKFKEAVKKAYNAKFLDDADMVIRFAEIVQAQPEEDNQSEQAPDEGNGDEGNPPDEQKAEEKPEENAGAEEEKQDKEINAIKEEQEILVNGMLACLKGLNKLGCDGEVTGQITAIENHLNRKAHSHS
jgi:hypothetical protein